VIDENSWRLNIDVNSRADLERITLARPFGLHLFWVNQGPGEAKDFLAFVNHRAGEDAFAKAAFANADFVTHRAP
jgi:hypothetical protein